MRRLPARQSGVTLIVTLIFLAMFMGIVVMMMNSSVINTKIAGNQQYTMEARSAAQQGIEQVISYDFTSNPAAAAVSVPVDVNGDGKTDYTAQVAAPTCLADKPILLTDLTTDQNNPNYADDQSCHTTPNQDNPLLTSTGANSGVSSCSNTQWDVAASVSDSAATSTNVTLHQGVAVRVLNTTQCP